MATSAAARRSPDIDHLGARGCMVYEHRPWACRSFDCRAFAAMDLVEYCDPNHRIPDWEFAEDGGER